MRSEEEFAAYKRVAEMRKIIIDDFLEQLKEETDRMQWPAAVRQGGEGDRVECEDRGYHIGIGQVQGIIERIRPKN